MLNFFNNCIFMMILITFFIKLNIKFKLRKKFLKCPALIDK